MVLAWLSVPTASLTLPRFRITIPTRHTVRGQVGDVDPLGPGDIGGVEGARGRGGPEEEQGVRGEQPRLLQADGGRHEVSLGGQASAVHDKRWMSRRHRVLAAYHWPFVGGLYQRWPRPSTAALRPM